jgi:hypothetical protein
VTPLDALQRAVAQRRSAAALLSGAAAGGALAVVLLLGFGEALAPLARVLLWLVLTAAGAAATWVRLPRHPRDVADAIEHALPAAANLVRTAVELRESTRAAVPAGITARVHADAATRTAGARPSQIVPLQRPLLLAVVPAALGVLLSTADSPAAVVEAILPGRERAAVALGDLVVAVTPPAYVGGVPQQLRRPEQVEALVGSRIALTPTGATRFVVVRAGGSDTVDAGATLRFTAESDDVITLLPIAADGRVGARSVLPLRVIPDAAPRVRIDSPARDLRVADGARRLEVELSATDDIGLTELTLRFTRVRGAGEQYAFVEGDAELRIERSGPTRWTARGTLRLDTLQLEPGDVVVYRALARDARPGALPSESETYIVDLTAPGGEAAEGFAADDEQDRYGLSQAMLILKTERLLKDAPQLSEEQRTRALLTLAAEQRSIRAEFVFMMGGELADDANDHLGHMHLNEEAEAEAEDDILAGRLANQGRLEMTRAIRSMSAAAQLLTGGDLPAALAEERRALAALERALARSRFILRALTTRERVDPARRLTGNAAGAVSSGRPVVVATADSVALTLRDGVRLLMRVGAATTVSASDALQVERVAQRVIALAAGDTLLLGAAEALLRDVHPDAAARAQREALERGIAVWGSVARTRLSLSAGARDPLGWRAFRGQR